MIPGAPYFGAPVTLAATAPRFRVNKQLSGCLIQLAMTWSKNLWPNGRCDHLARESISEHQRADSGLASQAACAVNFRPSARMTLRTVPSLGLPFFDSAL
jgi:hypothetical protein